MDYTINCTNNDIKTEIILPASKSISNRLLIIQALSEKAVQVYNLSDSDDTKVMLDAFNNTGDIIDIGHAGTSMRFLTAYYAATAQRKTITGSNRMKNRPIYELVNALNQLGADIKYAENVGFPPVITSGNTLIGNSIEINGNISSQYITALLLIAPALPQGLTIHIKGELISASYVDMTLGLMKKFGVSANWNGNIIHIRPQQYKGGEIIAEGDWSGASYWYEIAALSANAEIKIHGLWENSLQGDAAVAKIFEKIGVVTEFMDDVAIIRKTSCENNYFEYDFINNPDLVQTLVVTLCLLNIPFCVTGAETLRIKETDRIAALQSEMAKLGYTINEPQKGILTWNGAKTPPQEAIKIETYKDHRMALAFAPAAFKFKNLVIEDAGVVTKSYPTYWDDLKKAGFEVVEQGS